MTTHGIHRTIRMSALSVFLALAAFAFLAFGSVSAHTASVSQTGGSSTTTTTNVRIVSSQTSRASFNPNAITIHLGDHVRLVNKTTFTLLLFIGQRSAALAPGGAMTIIPKQSQVVRICAGGALVITVA